MKKKILFVFIILSCVAFSVPFAVFAAESELDDLYQACGADELSGSLPSETEEMLDNIGITALEPSFDAMDVLAAIFRICEDECKYPVKNGLVIIGMIVMLAFFGGIKDSLGKNDVSETVYTVTGFICILTLTRPLLSYFKSVEAAITAADIFEKSFVPVFCTLLIASGQQLTAVSGAAKLLTVSEITSTILHNILMPLCRIMLAACTASGMKTADLYSLTQMSQKAAKWILGILGTVTAAVLTLSGIVASSADSIKGKAAKFVVSGAVPIIGGAVGDALTNIKGCLTLLKSSSGAYGIIGCVFVFAPVLIQGILWVLVLDVCAAVAKAIDAKGTGKLLDTVSGVVSVCIAACVMMLFVLTASSASIIALGR